MLLDCASRGEFRTVISSRFTNGPRGALSFARFYRHARSAGGGSGARAPAGHDDDRRAKRGPREADSERIPGGPGAGRRQVRRVVRAPTARRPRCATRLCHDLSRGLRAESEIRAWGVAETTLRGVARLDARVLRHRRARRARPLFFHRARAFPRSPPLPHPPLPSRANLVHLSYPAAASGWRSGRRARTRTARA